MPVRVDGLASALTDGSHPNTILTPVNRSTASSMVKSDTCIPANPAFDLHAPKALYETNNRLSCS